jgi:ABC-type glycerol-3-phosphate transport system substrate-binding protein
MIVSLAAAALLLSACFTQPGAVSTFVAAQKTKIPTRAAPTPTSTPGPTSTTVPDELKVQLGGLKGEAVVLWHPFVGPVADLLSRMADEFSHENEWGLRASVVSHGGDAVLAEAVNQADDKTVPQAVLAPSTQLNSWMLSGRLAALDVYLSHAVVGMDEATLKGFVPEYWQQDRLNGAQTGLPALRTAYGLLYNLTWAKELGFEKLPVTPDDLRQQVCEAAKANNRSNYLDKFGTGGWLIDTSPETALSWLTAFGASPLPAEEGQPYHFDQPQALDAVNYLHKLQADGCLWEGRSPDPQLYFADRNALVVSGSLQDLDAQARINQGLEVKDTWVFLPYPGKDGKPFVFSGGYSYGLITTNPRGQMAAWLFLRWLSRPENQARLGEIYPSLPVSSGAKKISAAKQSLFPWTVILPLQEVARPAPALPGWQIARRPLEDAFWQVFHLASADQISIVLPQLDALVQELLLK